MSSAEGGPQSYGYSGGADGQRPTWAGADPNATEVAMASSPVLGGRRRMSTGRKALLGTGAALLIGSAFVAGQMRGPDRASASGGPGATPTATETPSATATPGSQDTELQPGQCVDFSASDNQVIIVQGDTTINGENIFDNDAQSAAEAVLTDGDYNICAPWGADVQQTTISQKDCILGADSEQALDKGFQRVTIFKFDNGHMVKGSRN